jgi:hypothetical protein
MVGNTIKVRVLLGTALLCAALAGQTQKSVAGTVIDFKALELGIRTDDGAATLLKFSPDTQVVTITPGEHDLSKAKPAAVTDIVVGDRIMATFVAGLTPARRIVLITGRDIAKRNEAERLDWKTRGISGIVSSVDGDRILIEIRTPEGAHTMTVTVDAKTKIRRYAPDSVRFADALPSSTAEISKGDQLQTRGTPIAEDVVFGTFLTKLGTITALNLETREIQIQEVKTKQSLTIHLSSASQMKKMPDMRAMLFGGKPADHSAPQPQPQPAGARFDLQKALESLPAATIDDLKVGGGIMVTSTKGVKNDELTAIMLLASADFFVTMMQSPAGEQSISQLHGGMVGGPGGISLPTMIQ